MPDTVQRIRVERQLRGDYRNDDVTRLFLYVRERSDGRQSVKDIGDFVAHHSERTKGVITRTTRDLATTARFMLPLMVHGPYDGARLPSNFRDVMTASMRQLPHATLKEATGIGLADATRMLPDILKGLKTNPDGTLCAHGGIFPPKVYQLIQFVSRTLVAEPAFNGDELYRDFVAVLRSRCLLHKTEERSFDIYRPHLALFALTAMHKSIVLASDGEGFTLQAIKTGPHITMAVSAAVPMLDAAKSIPFMAASAVYDSGLLLLGLKQPWDCELEVTPHGRLTRMQ